MKTTNFIQKSKQGAFVLTLGQILRFIAQIVSLITLARLLSPVDYGLTAIILAIIGVGEIVRDLGLSTASIQAETISHAEKSNLFWINVSLGLTFGLLLYLASPYLASFYHDVRLENIAKVMSVTFLLNGAASQLKAGLNRDLKFKQLAISDTSVTVISTLTGVMSALNGLGYWSIVIQTIVMYSLTLFAYFICYSWLPSLPRFDVNVRRFVSYGIHLMGSQIVIQFSKSIDSLVIGHRFGVDVLGVYNRAQQIVFMGLLQISPIANTIAIPVLSKLQNDKKQYAQYLIFGHSILLHVVCFLFTTLAINADWLVILILGQKWTSSIPILQILSVIAILSAADYGFTWIYLTKNYTKIQFKVNLYSRLFMIALIVIASLHSVYAVAVAYLLGSCVSWIYSAYTLNKLGEDICLIIRNTLTVCSSYFLILVILTSISNSIHNTSLSGIFLLNVLELILIALIYLNIRAFNETANNLFKIKRLMARNS